MATGVCGLGRPGEKLPLPQHPGTLQALQKLSNAVPSPAWEYVARATEGLFWAQGLVAAEWIDSMSNPDILHGGCRTGLPKAPFISLARALPGNKSAAMGAASGCHPGLSSCLLAEMVAFVFSCAGSTAWDAEEVGLMLGVLLVPRTEKLAHSQKDCKRNPEMETGSARSVEQEQARLHGNSVEGQTVWSGLQDTWLQVGPYRGAEDQLQQSRGQSEQLPNLSQGSSFETCFLASKAALPGQLQGCQVAVEQLQHKKPKRDGLSQMQSLECRPGQPQAPEMLLQDCQALKVQLQQSKAVTQEQERERSLQIERDWHMREQLRQAEISVHVLESSLDLYKKKYQAALGRVGELESQMQHLEEEAGRKAARCAKKLDNLWSSGQAEDGLGQLSAREMGWALQLTGQQDQTTQELQEQLAASHGKSRLLGWALSQLLQQKEAMASLHREFASYKLTHSCSNAKYRKQMISQAVLHQKLQQAEKEGLQQQAEAYRALVQELKLELAREAELNSKTLKDLARLELAVQSLCQEAATEQNWQLRELAVLQHHACPVQALLGQSHQLCTQKEWEAKQCRAVSWPGVTPVLQPRRPKSLEQFQKAAMEVAQEQRLESNLEPQRLGKVGCPLEVLLGRGCLAEAKLEQKSFLGGGGSPAAAISGRELLKELMEELSRSKRQPLQAASMLELELLRQQLQETEWRVQGLQACVMEQKAENHSLQEQLTKHMAVLGLVHGHFRQARLQLQHQAEEIESLQISLEASRAGHHWLHQESELVLANVRQWVKEQKQMNEELGHKLRMQIKQIAQLTGERDLLHQLLERLQEDNQQLKNEANEKRIICERIKGPKLEKADPE
ncbi:hypothetical protein Chor_004818 [Crotalus horridus]